MEQLNGKESTVYQVLENRRILFCLGEAYDPFLGIKAIKERATVDVKDARRVLQKLIQKGLVKTKFQHKELQYATNK